jgi:hypothetical protein
VRMKWILVGMFLPMDLHVPSSDLRFWVSRPNLFNLIWGWQEFVFLGIWSSPISGAKIWKKSQPAKKNLLDVGAVGAARWPKWDENDANQIQYVVISTIRLFINISEYSIIYTDCAPQLILSIQELFNFVYHCRKVRPKHVLSKSGTRWLNYLRLN